MPNDPKTLALIIFTGILPSLAWLWFWLREDRKNPEPKGLIALTFVMGMISVWIVLPIEKIIHGFGLPHTYEIIAMASSEEFIKFIFALALISNTDQADEPTDWPIYLITVALGFAALENILFMVKPFSVGQTSVALLTGELRFLGSTLLHTIASGLIGVSMGLSFYLGSGAKKAYVLCGIISAIALHSIFNFFIMLNGGTDFLRVFSFLWITTIIIFLLFEKLRRMNLSIASA